MFKTEAGCSKQKQGVQNRNKVSHNIYRVNKTETGCSKQKQGVPQHIQGVQSRKGVPQHLLGCPKQKHLNLFLSLFFCHKSTDRCYKIMRVVKKSCRIISDLGFSIFGLVFFRNQYRVFEFRSNPPMNVNMNLIINDLHQFFIMERDQRLTL